MIVWFGRMVITVFDNLLKVNVERLRIGGVQVAKSEYLKVIL